MNRPLTASMLVSVVGLAIGGCASSPSPIWVQSRPFPAPDKAAASSNLDNTVAMNGPASNMPAVVSANTAGDAPNNFGTNGFNFNGANSNGLNTNGSNTGGNARTPFNAQAFSALVEGENATEDFTLTPGLSRVSFSEEGSDFDPCVSRDGTKLVFASTQHRSTPDLYLKRPDSRVVTQLTNDPAQDAMPSISPDGTRIAFASDRAGNWDIYVMPITGGRPVQLTEGQGDEVHPSWSPDGNRLVFSRMGQASGRWEMWVCDVANPTASSFIGYGALPRWAPVAGAGENGADRILYQLGRERGRRAFSLWTVDLAGNTVGNPTEIASSSTSALINPTWSPDAQWIAYTEVPFSDDNTPSRWTQANMPSNGTLWMLSATGEARVRLTGDVGVALSPWWAENNRLFFVSNREGGDNIWSLDATQALASARAAMGGTTATAAAGSGGSNPAANHTQPRAAQSAPVHNNAKGQAEDHALPSTVTRVPDHYEGE